MFKERGGSKLYLIFGILFLSLMIMPTVSAFQWCEWVPFWECTDDVTGNTLTAGAKWILDYSTDEDSWVYISDKHKHKSTICLINDSVSRKQDLQDKPFEFYEDVKGKGEKNKLPKIKATTIKAKDTEFDYDIHGWCYTIKDKEKRVKFGEQSTVVEYQEDNLEIKNDENVTLQDITLLENSDQCLINCFVKGKSEIYNDSVLFNGYDFKDNNNNIVNLSSTQIYILNESTITHSINISEYQCEEITDANGTNEVCEKVNIGLQNVTEDNSNYYLYDFSVLPAGVYDWKIEGKKGVGQEVDWGLSLQGFDTDTIREYWAWWNSSWANKKPLSANTSLGTTLPNYQLHIVVDYEADMNVDFSDLRFLDENETNELDYYIEEIYNSTNASIWIELPQGLTTTNQTVAYMYYNNPAVTLNASNGEETFTMFDDFNAVNGTRWTVVNGEGSQTVSEGVLIVNDDWIIADSSHSNGHAFEVLFNYTIISGTQYFNAPRNTVTALWDDCIVYGYDGASSGINHNCNENLWSTNTLKPLPGPKYTLTVVAPNTSAVLYFRNDVLTTLETSNVPDEPLRYSVRDTGVGSFGLEWVRVRVYNNLGEAYGFDAQEGLVSITVEIIEPINGSVLNLTQTDLSCNCFGSGTNCTAINLSVDDTIYNSTTGNGNLTISATLNLNDGEHTLFCNGTDGTNYVNATSTFSIDTTAPIVNITSPLNGSFITQVNQTIDLNWTIIEDNLDVCWYNFGNYCFQESANISDQTGMDGSCGLDYSGTYTQNITEEAYYVNYSVPEGTTSESFWQIAVQGASSTSLTFENVTLDETCWNTETLQLRFFQNATIQSQCHNGTDWIILRTDIIGSGGGGTVGCAGAYGQWYDGDYSTWTIKRDASLYAGSPACYWDLGMRIYEESMYWKLADNIVNCALNTTTFNYPIPTPESLTTFLYANDTLGNLGTDNVTILRPINEIDITITAPSNGSIINSFNESINLNFTIDSPNATLDLCWYTTSESATKVFTTCSLNTTIIQFPITNPDLFIIYFSANDTFSNSAIENVTVVKSTTEPNIIIVSPPVILPIIINSTVIDLDLIIVTNGTLDICWFNYNSIDTIFNCALNTSFTYVGDVDTITVYANDTLGNEGNETQSWTIPLILLGQFYVNETLEGISNAFVANVQTNDSISSGTLIYNDTNYSGVITEVTSNNYNVSYNLIAPSVDNDTTFSFHWELELDGIGNAVLPTLNQTVNTVMLDNCSTYIYEILNISLFEERSLEPLLGTIEVALNVLDTIEYGIVEELSGEFANVSNTMVCSSVNLSGQDLVYSAEIKYYATEFESELYFIQRSPFEEVDVVDLYDLNSSYSTEFLVEYENENYVIVPGAVIQLQRKYLPDDIYRVVEAPLTSTDGTAVLHIDLDSNLYKVTVVKDGELLEVFDNIVFNCQNLLSGECTQNLRGSIDPNNYVNIETVNDFAYVISNLLDTVTVTWSVPSQTTADVNLQLRQIDGYGNNTVCDKTISSSAGSIICTYDNETIVDSYLYLDLYKDGEPMASTSYYVKPSGNLDFLNLNFIIVFIFILSIAGMAFSSPEWVVVNGIMVMVISGGLYLLNGLNFVMGLGALMWLVVGASILIYKMAQQEDR